MNAQDTSHVLRIGLTRVLEIWRTRFEGERDLLQGVLAEQLADITGTPSPGPASDEVSRHHAIIRAYFDNVRYALLSPTARVWGTLTNAMRVAAKIDSVTATQARVFGFAPESLASFFRAAQHDGSLAASLRDAFRPMPAADCQTLAALFDIHAPVDGASVIAVIRVLGNEGPLTSEEAEAISTLRATGLVGAAFAGIRRET